MPDCKTCNYYPCETLKETCKTISDNKSLETTMRMIFEDFISKVECGSHSDVPDHINMETTMRDLSLFGGPCPMCGKE